MTEGLKTDIIINRDALFALRELPDESVNCCVTSPPYYALRDYGLDAQIGREDTPEEYIERLVAVFHELKRVLRSDGTFWLNIADTYCGTGNKGYYADPKNPKGRNGQQTAKNARAPGCKQKDLIGIPWLLAFALRADGWYLRSDIIWQKENPMPESCKDRPSRCYEHIFLLTKSKKYFYDAAAIAEPIASTTAARYRTGRGAGHKYADEVPGQGKVQGINRTRSGGYYTLKSYSLEPNRVEFQKQCIFQSFCKRVLHNEACNAHEEIRRRRAKEVSFSDLALHEERQLYTLDKYFQDEEAEPSYQQAGKKITPKLLLEAIRTLPEEKRKAIMLYYFEGMTDVEIGKLFNTSRSTIQYRRTSSFEILKKYLEEHADEWDKW